MEISKLFEHPVTRSGQISLADQIHDILCEEIHAGRWEVGEKLPSMMTIANQCNVSRMPVQQAIERLGAEGYVRQENRSGIYLASIMPEGREPIGIIGVVILAEPQTDREADHLAFEQLITHRIMREAEKRNYQLRIHYTTPREDWSRLNVVGQVFDRSVKGIISLLPIPNPADGMLAEGRIPMVFLGEPSPCCSPCIASDYEQAMYQLTVRMIRLGHKNIAPVGHPSLTADLETAYLKGYRKAMKAHGLDSQTALHEASKMIDPDDLDRLKEAFTDLPDNTALICFHSDRLTASATVLKEMGRAIPEEISLAGVNPQENKTRDGKAFSGVTYSAEKEIDQCFKQLRKIGLARKWEFGTILMKPIMVEGETLAPPP